MNHLAHRHQDAAAVEAELLFAVPGGEPPRVVIPAGDDATTRFGGLDTRMMAIVDASAEAGRFRLDREGFAFRHWPTALSDFDDDAEIARVYYPEIRAIVAEAVGASEVEIFDHTIRVTDPNTTHRRPASHAHNDYTVNSGPKRLADMIGTDRAEAWLAERVVQVNVWRPIAEPVLRMPLALLDQTSMAADDLIETEIVNERQGGRVGQIYSVAHRPGQRWVYFPHMRMDEVILIKGYDSATDGRARFAPHSAFDDPATPADAPERRSIEVRTFARVRVGAAA